MNCLAFLAMSFCKDPNWVDDLFEDVNDMDGPVAEDCVDTTLDAALVGDTTWEKGWQPLHSIGAAGPKELVFGNLSSDEVKLLTEHTGIEPTDSSSDAVMDTQLAPIAIGELQCVDNTQLATSYNAELQRGDITAAPETGFAKRVTLVEVSLHRRVHKHQRGRFVASITSEIKAKMGIPAKSKANDLTIRYLANGRCKELGVRPKHAQAIVELVLVMVYTPDQCDIAAAKLNNSGARKAAWNDYSWANKSLLYRTFTPRFLHDLNSHGPVNGPVGA